jgi:hypothetical protein
MTFNSLSGEGSLKIKLSSKTTIYTEYHIDGFDDVYDDEGISGRPLYSKIILDTVYMNDADITDLALELKPLTDFLISKIQDEQD